MKKSSSAVSGYEATIRKKYAQLEHLLALSDDDSDLFDPPPPKRYKSDISPSPTTPSPSFHACLSESPTERVDPNPKMGLEAARPFLETPAPLFDSLLPDELAHDIENAALYSYQPLKPDIEDYCSSSSEFEIDDDSDSDGSPSTSEVPAVSLKVPPAIGHSTNLYSSLSEFPSSKGYNAASSASTPGLNTSNTQQHPRHQAAITSYFGLQRRDGSTTQPVRSVVPNSSIFTKKRASYIASRSISTVLQTTTVETSTGEKENYWTREPTIKDQCPFYKRIAGTTFIVDDFRFIYKSPITNCFFLTHFHSDHYQGLTSKFRRGLIYCSPVTGSLLTTVLRVDSRYIVPIPLRTPTLVEGVECTFLDANHCPGAVIILFRLTDGTVHLHTGDFRFDNSLPDHLQTLSLPTQISNLYLDTTYADSRYTFPHQQFVISHVLDLIAPYAKDTKTLLVVGTYTIGKERIFLALAERFGLKFYVKPSKLKVLRCLEINPVLREWVTTDENEARMHVISISDLSIKKLEDYLAVRPSWSRIVAVRPTGWSYTSGKKFTATSSHSAITPFITGAYSTKNKANLAPNGFSTSTSKSGLVTIHSAPYSEHSSFSELCNFVRSLKPRWVIPTVNNRSREAVIEMVRNLRG